MMKEGVSGSGNNEFSLVKFTVGGEAIPTDETTTNFFRQDDVFTQAKNKTIGTPEVDDVWVEIKDNDATKRDRQGYDIAGRPYNISGFRVMKGSEMYDKFLEINGDDFTEGLNDKGERVMLFDSSKSDNKIKMFSVEEDADHNIYYAIKDANGNIFKFKENGSKY